MGLGKIQRCFQRNRLQYEIGWEIMAIGRTFEEAIQKVFA